MAKRTQPLRQLAHDPLRRPALGPLAHEQARPQDHAVHEAERAHRLLQLALHARIEQAALGVGAGARHQHVGARAALVCRARQRQVQVVVDGALRRGAARRSPRRAQRAEEERRLRGRELRWPEGRVADFERLELRGVRMRREGFARVGVDGCEGWVLEERGEDV